MLGLMLGDQVLNIFCMHGCCVGCTQNIFCVLGLGAGRPGGRALRCLLFNIMFNDYVHSNHSL